MSLSEFLFYCDFISLDGRLRFIVYLYNQCLSTLIYCAINLWLSRGVLYTPVHDAVCQWRKAEWIGSPQPLHKNTSILAQTITLTNKYGTTAMVINATFNNISIISWRSTLWVEENGGTREKHRPVASNYQALSHNIVPSTFRLELDTNSQLKWWYTLITYVVLCDHDPDVLTYKHE